MVGRFWGVVVGDGDEDGDGDVEDVDVDVDGDGEIGEVGELQRLGRESGGDGDGVQVDDDGCVELRRRKDSGMLGSR